MLSGTWSTQGRYITANHPGMKSVQPYERDEVRRIHARYSFTGLTVWGMMPTHAQPLENHNISMINRQTLSARLITASPVIQLLNEDCS